MKNYEADVTALETLNEIADHYVCVLLNKNIKRIRKELGLMENDKLKEIIVRKFNKKVQLMNTTTYEHCPNLEIRIGS